MIVTAARVLILIAVICFVVAWLMASSIVDGGNVTAWLAAGLASFAAAHAVP